MSASQTTGFSLKRAYVVSIALHVFFAAFLILASRHPDAMLDARRVAKEDVRVATVTIVFRARRTVAIVTPRKRAHELVVFRPMAPPTAHRAALITPNDTMPARTRTSVASTVGLHPRPLPARSAPAAPVRSEGAHRMPAPTLAAPMPAQSQRAVALLSPAPTSPAAAETAAAAVPLVQTAAYAAEVPNGGWGQKFAKPLVADDEALATLRSSIRTSTAAKATIEVDDNGRATHVSFQKPLASDVRAELEKRLLAMHYIPAECNGLRCSGTLELTL